MANGIARVPLCWSALCYLMGSLRYIEHVKLFEDVGKVGEMKEEPPNGGGVFKKF
jgi:NADH:ubiquinone oxidoreductase subunit E